ncbi:uncharacterized protein DS421_15g491210 [Arachis hypogaea]|nr:uncharacterized protein DS421_15g491210 [Arachis hypogaea]
MAAGFRKVGFSRILRNCVRTWFFLRRLSDRFKVQSSNPADGSTHINNFISICQLLTI